MRAGTRQAATNPLVSSPRRTLATLCLFLGTLGALWPGTSAFAQSDGDERFVDVVEVAGLIDPVIVDFLDQAIDDSEADGAEVLIVQLDSSGSVVSQAELDALAFRLGHADVPVAVWVGPSGARATGGAALLVTQAPLAGMAPGSRVGRAPAPALGELPPDVRRGTVSAEEAFDLGLVQLTAEESAVLGNFLVGLDGLPAAGRTVDTADRDDDGNRTANVEVRLAKLELLPGFMHTVASPAVTYLLLAAGLALLVFEFFTAGVGIAGVVGAGSLVLAAYGLSVLPTSPWGLALIGAAVLGYAIDVQTGVPRFWTAFGTVAFVVGSFVLFDDLAVPWPALVAGIVGMVLMMLGGMPAMVRSRFSTPTIGRQAMIGELGEAVAAVRPDGVVRVRDALWRARTNRATPIAAGDPVRVVGIDGLLLEVEPEEGGARDYRH